MSSHCSLLYQRNFLLSLLTEQRAVRSSIASMARQRCHVFRVWQHAFPSVSVKHTPVSRETMKHTVWCIICKALFKLQSNITGVCLKTESILYSWDDSKCSKPCTERQTTREAVYGSYNSAHDKIIRASSLTVEVTGSFQNTKTLFVHHMLDSLQTEMIKDFSKRRNKEEKKTT